MAKQSGLGDQLFFGGVDLGADINSIGGLSTPRETLPATDITQEAMARMFGKRDAAAEFISYFDPAAGMSHETLSALPRTDVHVMYLRGEAIGNEAFALVGKQVDYSGTRGDDGSFLMGVSVPGAAYGGDWCTQLTAGKDTHASGASTTSLEVGAATAFGWQAYLQVFSIGSGTADIDIETSSDNGSGDAFASIQAFTSVTAAGVERVQSSSSTAAVERYIRVTTSNTFTDLVFAVVINVNQAARAL